MNGLGHPFVAFKTVGRMNSWLAAGSLLPDLVPFIVHENELFDLIHEGGESFLKYLDKDAPEARDLGLGMIAHGVKHGADQFNRTIDQWLLKGNEQLAKEIAEKIVACSGVSFKVAREYRLHNYLWAGIDVYLINNEKIFVRQLNQAHQGIEKEKVAHYLAAYLGRDRAQVEGWVNNFFDYFTTEALSTLSGLTDVWQKVMAGLPERDLIDKNKTEQLFNDIYVKFKGDWPEILDQVIGDVKKQVSPFLII